MELAIWWSLNSKEKNFRYVCDHLIVFNETIAIMENLKCMHVNVWKERGGLNHNYDIKEGVLRDISILKIEAKTIIMYVRRGGSNA